MADTGELGHYEEGDPQRRTEDEGLMPPDQFPERLGLLERRLDQLDVRSSVHRGAP